MRNLLNIALFLALSAASDAGAEDIWPDLSRPARAVHGGEHDAAVVVGVEHYFAVPGVPGAKANAGEWYDYLTATRGIPPQNVKLLTNADATREEILASALKAAGQAGAKGTLWFVFVGHGAPSSDGKDGLLVGADAQQKSESLQSRSVRRSELLKTLTGSRAGAIRVVLDACFSGRGQDGSSIAPGLQPLVTVASAGALDPRVAVLTAAKGDQFAGSLPGVNRPAFSYLVLGGLRGWAGAADGKITAGSLWTYTRNALAATLRGRDQTPDLMGAENASMGSSAGEKGPNLAGLAKATAGGGSIQFNVSALPEVPKANMPSMSAVGRLPSAQLPGEMEQPQGIDFGAVDVDALGEYDEAVIFEKSDAPPESKAAKWRALGANVTTYEDVAAKRAAQWDDYADQAAFNAVLANEKSTSSPEDKAAKWKELAANHQKYRQTAEQRIQEWERYAKELTAAAAIKEKRDDLMVKDWSKLEKLLSFSVVSAADKRKFSATFVQAYGRTSQDNPYVGVLEKYLPAGTVSVTPGVAAPTARPSRVGIQWITIPGGSFMIGSEEDSNEKPRREVSIKSFQMAKTEVTNRQYKACVDAGVCTLGDSLGAPFGDDDHPAVNVDWNQANAYSKWAGGRLPSEAEWEYAARSAGKDRYYPWGNKDATCSLAVISGCGSATSAVCSKPEGDTQQGLCDMAGNALEWVQDWYHDSYDKAPKDGSAWINPRSSTRVSRGGSWDHGGSDSQSARRNNFDPGYRNYYLGFRPAR